MQAPPIIIGAGLAGLAAGWRLHQAGLNPILLDPAPGGKARTFAPDPAHPGWRIENGPHTFTGRAHRLHALCTEMGLTPIPLGASAKRRFLRRGDRLLTAGIAALSWRQRWELLCGLIREVRHDPAESVAAWVTRRFGPSLAGGPVAAMMKGIWAARPEEVEFRTGFPTLWQASQGARLISVLRQSGGTGGAFSLSGGLGALTGALAARLDCRPLSVRAIRRTPDGFQIDADASVMDSPARDPVHLHTDRLLIATDSPAAARLLRELCPEAAAGLAALPTAPLLVAHWLSPDAAFPAGFGFLSETDEHGDSDPLLGTIFLSDLLPDRVPAGMRGFTSMLGGTLCRDALSWSADRVQVHLRDVHRRLTGRDCQIAALHLCRHPHAVALPAPGHPDRVRAIDGTLPPGIQLAGAWRLAGAMPCAVAAGEAAADRLCAVPALEAR